MERLTGSGQQPTPHAAHADARAHRGLWVISPCFNRPADAQNLCEALGKVRVPASFAPTLVLVDNASSPPIARSLPARPLPEPWNLIQLPQPTNTGGSGGFNAGLASCLGLCQGDDLLWLLDSDAIPEAEALGHLIDAMALPDVVMAGSTLIDPASGEPFECGGFINAVTGEYQQSPPVDGAPVPCQYLAACSILTTADVVRRSGLFPDTFLNGDDVGWGCRVRRATRGRLVGVPASRVAHPGPDRMRTAARYFAARGAMVALPEAGVPVFGRALREAMRAASLHATGLHALGDLHLAGLRDAATGRVMGGLPPGLDAGGADHQVSDLSLPQRAVSARGRGGDWFNQPGTVALDGSQGWTISSTPTTQAARAVRVLLSGLGLAIRLQRSNGAFGHCPPAPLAHEVSGVAHGLSIVIVAYNRKDALLRTLARLGRSEPGASAEVIVVDNASSDQTAEAVRARFPDVRLIELSENTGVAAFNRGVEASTGQTVLILDDDSWPDAVALALGLELLAERSDIVAVAFHPRHPDGGRSEWPFARRVHEACDAWPVMGCGNLVRKAAWARAGGYCEGYFLYRNDTDLALSLGALGGVWFDPSWVVWHDSPAAASKSVRWCHLATRNWLWMAKRHGRSPHRAWAWLGVAQAFRLAGWRPEAVRAVVAGVRDGLYRKAPAASVSSPTGWKALIGLRLGKPMPRSRRYVGPCPNHTTRSTHPAHPAHPTLQAPRGTSPPTSSERWPTTRST